MVSLFYVLWDITVKSSICWRISDAVISWPLFGTEFILDRLSMASHVNDSAGKD